MYGWGVDQTYVFCEQQLCRLKQQAAHLFLAVIERPDGCHSQQQAGLCRVSIPCGNVDEGQYFEYDLGEPGKQLFQRKL